MGMGVPGVSLAYPTGSETMVWAGKLTSTSFRVISDFTQLTKAVALVVSANSDMSSPVFTSGYKEPLFSQGSAFGYKTVILDATGLTPNTTYYYQLTSLGASDQAGHIIRSLKTAPAVAAAFRFVFGSCTLWDNSHPDEPIFRAIALDNPLFILHGGDRAYPDIASVSPTLPRDVLSRVYRSKLDVDVMHRSVPGAYIWGDHDSGINDNSLDTANQATIYSNIRAEVRETTPIYDTNTANDLTQVFDIGKCRFILLDLQSYSSQSGHTAVGAAQLAWFIGASGPLQTAAAAGIKHIFLFSCKTWTGTDTDNMGSAAYAADRAAICAACLALSIPVTVLAGDAHEGAFDDGTNSGGLKQILSSPLAQTTTLTGSGPYSWNGQTVTNRFQNNRSIYCVVDVSADNVSWTATMKGGPYNASTYAPTTLGSVSSTDIP